MIDLAAAANFIAGHARLLERRRFAVLEGDGSPQGVLAALAAYQNADGGIGHLEPDLRTPASQPACVLYALEIMNEIQSVDERLATEALDWLATVTLEDGGVPFVLPSARDWPHAPWWSPPERRESSLLMTAGIAAAACRLGLDHRWLGPATAYCWAHADQAPRDSAYTLRYLLDFLDAVADRSRATSMLDDLAHDIPPDGALRVDGGAEGEMLRPLVLAPRPEHLARRLFDDGVIDAELDRLAGAQQSDGGWTFDWADWNPAATCEWRGVVTVSALWTLGAYGRLDLALAGGRRL